MGWGTLNPCLAGTQNFDTKTVQGKELLANLLLEAGAVDVYPASLAQERFVVPRPASGSELGL